MMTTPDHPIDSGPMPVSIGEILGDSFKVVACRCRKCGAETAAFAMAADFALCDSCDAIEVATRRAAVAADEKAWRVAEWARREIPFDDTVLEQIPCDWSRLRQVIEWQYGRKGMIIHGATGRGKTRAVILLLRRIWIDEGHDFLFVSTPRWCHDIETAGFGWQRTLIHSLLYVPVLVLDDLGKERQTERGISALFDVLDTRTSFGRPCIFTTNYTGQKLVSRFSERDAETAAAILRRIREFCTEVGFIAKKEAQ